MSGVLLQCALNTHSGKTNLHLFTQKLQTFHDYAIVTSRNVRRNSELSVHMVNCVRARARVCVVGRDTSVGIEIRYGLDGPGIESRWGARFSTPVQTGPEAYPASYTMVTGSFPGVKRSGRGDDHLHPPSAEDEGRVELYIYSPSGPLWHVLG